MSAPVILAMGKGSLALKIREQARHYSKPILRKPELARALYGKGQLNAIIPVDTFNEVAAIYRWLINQGAEI
jgi:flagellar biosynthesis protein FlhB